MSDDPGMDEYIISLVKERKGYLKKELDSMDKVIADLKTRIDECNVFLRALGESGENVA